MAELTLHISRERKCCLINGADTIGYPYLKKINLDSPLVPYKKNQPKMVKDLHITKQKFENFRQYIEYLFRQYIEYS